MKCSGERQHEIHDSYSVQQLSLVVQLEQSNRLLPLLQHPECIFISSRTHTYPLLSAIFCDPCIELLHEEAVSFDPVDDSRDKCNISAYKGESTDNGDHPPPIVKRKNGR